MRSSFWTHVSSTSKALFLVEAESLLDARVQAPVIVDNANLVNGVKRDIGEEDQGALCVCFVGNESAFVASMAR